MKVNVNFGEVKIVVPCGDGEMTVKELGMFALSRFKSSAGKNASFVDIHGLRSPQGGMLFPEDRIGDVCDDKDELVADFELNGAAVDNTMASNAGMGGGANNFSADEEIGDMNGSNSGSGFVVNLRGLPYKATKNDIENFFEGLEIEKNGILICTDYIGRPNGDAYVRFTSQEDMKSAIGKHKENMDTRYIEVYESSMDEIGQTNRRSGASRNPGMANNPRPGMPGGGGGAGYHQGTGGGPVGRMGKYVLRARGLPFKASPYDIAEWFSDVAQPIDVRIDFNERGLPNGDAFVTFASPIEAMKAATKNKHNMQNRYIEIYFVRHIITMRGLPFRVTPMDIAAWFLPLADPLDVQLDYRDDGRPNGDAKVMFATQEEAQMAMKKNKMYMENRYIELYYEGPDYSRP